MADTRVASRYRFGSAWFDAVECCGKCAEYTECFGRIARGECAGYAVVSILR